jgi:hypothetical protein
MEDLGLTEYALRRFALAGNPRDWIARIEELAQSGATRLWVSLRGGDVEGQLENMRLLGREVMGRFVR